MRAVTDSGKARGWCGLVAIPECQPPLQRPGRTLDSGWTVQRMSGGVNGGKRERPGFHADAAGGSGPCGRWQDPGGPTAGNVQRQAGRSHVVRTTLGERRQRVHRCCLAVVGHLRGPAGGSAASDAPPPSPRSPHHSNPLESNGQANTVTLTQALPPLAGTTLAQVGPPGRTHRSLVVPSQRDTNKGGWRRVVKAVTLVMVQKPCRIFIPPDKRGVSGDVAGWWVDWRTRPRPKISPYDFPDMPNISSPLEVFDNKA